MEINKTELKVIMFKFNSTSNRLLQSSYDSYLDDLKRFCNYLESNELIMEYINSCGGYTSEIESLLDDCMSQGGKINFSLDENEETSEIYSLIKVICNRNYQIFPHSILLHYSSSSKFSDKLKEFNHSVVFALINHINDYLKKVGIEMGMDDNVTYNIHGQQVNIANDNASISAVQNNYGIDVDQLKDLITSMREAINSDLSPEDIKDVNECIDVIEGELASAQPNEDRVKDKFKILSRIDAGAKFASACCSLLTFADKVHPFLDQIIPWFQSLI